MAQRLSAGTKRKNININMTYGCATKDPNTYCYKLDEKGRKYLHRIILGRGWENWPLNYTALSCYEEKKGEDKVIEKKAAPPKEELLKLWEKHGVIDPIRIELKAGWGTTRRWLMEAGIIGKDNKAIPQTPPEPEQAANQEPAQDVGESAETIIPESGVGKPGVQPTVMPYGCELPPRTGYTSSQYQDAIRPEDVDMDEIEPEPWETDIIARGMIESWILDVYRLDINKRLKKRLIGQLLDMEVG